MVRAIIDPMTHLDPVCGMDIEEEDSVGTVEHVIANALRLRRARLSSADHPPA